MGRVNGSSVDAQGDLFGGPVREVWRPRPESVRNRLKHILAELREAETLPWDEAVLNLQRYAVADCVRWLPPEEGREWEDRIYGELARLGLPDLERFRR